jgi:ribosomal protein L29
MKIQELKNKTVVELEKVLSEKREILRDMRFRDSQKQLKNVREIRTARKNVSKILTILTTKKKEQLVAEIKEKIDK